MHDREREGADMVQGRHDPGGLSLGSRASAELFNAVVEASDDAIFTCDSNGVVTTWSVNAERLFGRSADEVVGGPLSALFPGHLRNEAQVLAATLLAGERVEHFETEILRPDRMPVPVSLSSSPIAGGSPLEAVSVVIVRDVTEQRLAQATLAEVETRLEEGEALAHVGSWLWDIRTGAVQWSAEFHRIHGVDPLDFDGTLESYLELVHPADRELVRTAMEESVASGRYFEHEYRALHPDLQVHVVHARAQPAIGSTGTVVGLRGIGQDVTESIMESIIPVPPDA